MWMKLVKILPHLFEQVEKFDDFLQNSLMKLVPPRYS